MKQKKQKNWNKVWAIHFCAAALEFLGVLSWIACVLLSKTDSYYPQYFLMGWLLFFACTVLAAILEVKFLEW